MQQLLRQPTPPAPSPPPAGPAHAWPTFTGRTARYALEWGVGVSLALHALLLSIHFGMPDFSKMQHNDKGLEVVLVNARHAQRPDTADILAQTNLDAGGNTDKKSRPATPLPPQEQTRVGDSLVEAQRRSEDARTQQVQAMTAARSKAALAVDTQQVTPTDAPRILEKALREKARDVFAERLRLYASHLGITVPTLGLSAARTRWGSCSLRSGIRLNWRLIHFPLHIIDYVVAHELAHVREMNHSPRFWAIVGQLYPEYKAAKIELKQLAATCPRW